MMKIDYIDFYCATNCWFEQFCDLAENVGENETET